MAITEVADIKRRMGLAGWDNPDIEFVRDIVEKKVLRIFDKAESALTDDERSFLTLPIYNLVRVELEFATLSTADYETQKGHWESQIAPVTIVGA